MNWEALGAIGEIVGAVAVVITIAYLAVQIRQNSRSLRAAAYQDAVRSANDWSSLLVRDPELYALFSRGIGDYSSMSEEELGRFSHLLYMGMRNYQVAERLAGEDLISDDISEAYEATFGAIFKSPKMLEWLRGSEGYVSSDVLEKIRDRVAAAQAAEPDRP